MARRKFVCSRCGGTDIKFDAWGYWDIEEQRMLLEQSFDACWCEDCQHEAHAVSVDLSDTATPVVVPE